MYVRTLGKLYDQQIKFVCRLNAEDMDELAKKLHDKI